MIQFIRIPKIQLAIALLAIYLSALFHSFSATIAINLFLILSVTIASDFIFLKVRKSQLFFPSAAIVSGLIIALLAIPNLPWYDLVFTAILAIAFKNFVRMENRHIFNPAAIGLFLTSFIFNHSVSWWAVSFQRLNINNLSSIIFLLILLSPGLVSMIRMKRYRITLSFLATYYIFISILNSHFLASRSGSLFTSLLDPTILFFSLVMLPEPMTTPNNHTRQIIFGIFVGLISLFVSLSLFSFLPDPLITSLLVANLLFFKLK